MKNAHTLMSFIRLCASSEGVLSSVSHGICQQLETSLVATQRLTTRSQLASINALSAKSYHREQLTAYSVAPSPSSPGTHTSTLPFSILSPSVACTLSVLLK